MEISKILERLDELIEAGKYVRNSCTQSYSGYMLANEEKFRKWRTSCLSFLNILPREYIYNSEFKDNCRDNIESSVAEGMGVLQAAREDIAGGYLQKVESLVSAEVFSDFLEMAEHLLDNEYISPAASLVGAVLENELRRVSKEHNIPVKNDDNIGSLNQRLFQKDVYGKPQMRQISIWQAIRDSADHGKFEDYDAETVKHMLDGVRKFLVSQLG